MINQLGWILAVSAGICAPSLALPHPSPRTFSLITPVTETVAATSAANLVPQVPDHHHNTIQVAPGDATDSFTNSESSILERSPVTWDNGHHHVVLPPHYRIPYNATLAVLNTTAPHHFRPPYPHCHIEVKKPDLDQPRRLCIFYDDGNPGHNHSHPIVIIPPNDKKLEGEKSAARLLLSPALQLHINYTTEHSSFTKRSSEHLPWSPAHPDALIASSLATDLAAAERNLSLISALFSVNNTDPTQFRGYRSKHRKLHTLRRHHITGPSEKNTTIIPSHVADKVFDNFCTAMLFEIQACWENARSTRPWIFRDAVLIVRKRAILNFISPLAVPLDGAEKFEGRPRHEELMFATGGAQAGDMLVKQIADSVELMRKGTWNNSLKNAFRKRRFLKQWGVTKYGTEWCVAAMFEDDECAFVGHNFKWQSPTY